MFSRRNRGRVRAFDERLVRAEPVPHLTHVVRLIHTTNPGKGDVFPFLLMKKVRLR